MPFYSRSTAICSLTRPKRKSYKSKIEGDGVAAAYNVQKEALGQQNVAIIKIIQEIAAGKIQIVPQILVGDGNGSTSGNLFNAWMSQMISQNIQKHEEN